MAHYLVKIGRECSTQPARKNHHAQIPKDNGQSFDPFSEIKLSRSIRMNGRLSYKNKK